MTRRTEPTATEPRVTIAELADQLGLPGDTAFTVLARRRVKVAGDWAGRPSLSVADAARAFAAIAGEQQAGADKWRAYEAYREDRERRLAETASVAARAAYAAASGGDAARRIAGQQAANAARQQAEQAEPLQDFESFRTGGHA